MRAASSVSPLSELARPRSSEASGSCSGAMRAVLPKSMPVLPVGGISPEKMAGYREAGAAGFGLGSALYKPGMTAAEVAENARDFIAALDDGAAG